MENAPAPGLTPSARQRAPLAVEMLVLILAAVGVLTCTGVPRPAPATGEQTPREQLAAVVSLLGDTANSRLATVYTLVHLGTWRIDTPQGVPPILFERGTVDKVEVDGRLLSSKPPILPLLMTAEYALLHRLPGWSLEDPEETRKIVYVMTVSLVGLAYLVTLFFFSMTLRLVCDAPWARAFALFVLAFGTQLPGLATDLNNHVPAAALLMVSVYFALGLYLGRLDPRPWRFFSFGLAGALVFTLDMPLTVFVAIAGLGLLWKFPVQAALWGGLGLVPPLALHFSVMWMVTGSILPVQMRPELYLYESSPWRTPGDVDALNEPKGIYLFHMTFGRNGLFLLFPVLMLGVFEPLRALFRPTPGRVWLLAGFAGFLILSAYYLLKTNNYGGASYGFRWYVASMPVLLLMAAPLLARMRRPLSAVIVVLLLAVSMFSAWESHRMPWGSDHEWTCRWIFGPVYGTPSGQRENQS